jgi:hypothetical protein
MKTMVFITNKILTIAVHFSLYLLGLYITIRPLLFAQVRINPLINMIPRDSLYAVSSVIYLLVGITGFISVYKFFNVNGEIIFTGKKDVSRNLIRTCLGMLLYGMSTGITLVAFITFGLI